MVKIHQTGLLIFKFEIISKKHFPVFNSWGIVYLHFFIGYKLLVLLIQSVQLLMLCS
jgi:hypothetical protein